jgi:hypothetical protein
MIIGLLEVSQQFAGFIGYGCHIMTREEMKKGLMSKLLFEGH